MKCLILVLLSIVALTNARNFKVHSRAQTLAETIVNNLGRAIELKDTTRIASQIHHDFHFEGCGHRLSRSQFIKFLTLLPENFKYQLNVFDAVRVGQKSVKYIVEWIFDQHHSAYEFVATKHHNGYVLEHGKRTDCVLKGL